MSRNHEGSRADASFDAPGSGDPGDALREAFVELRRAEERAAPPLPGLMSRASARGTRGQTRSRWLVPPWTAVRWAAPVAVLAAVALGLWFGREGGRPRPRTTAGEVPTLAHWVAPTDFLLDTPGVELLRSTPQIPAPLPLGLEPILTEPTKGEPR